MSYWTSIEAEWIVQLKCGLVRLYRLTFMQQNCPRQSSSFNTVVTVECIASQLDVESTEFERAARSLRHRLGSGAMTSPSVISSANSAVTDENLFNGRLELSDVFVFLMQHMLKIEYQVFLHI